MCEYLLDNACQVEIKSSAWKLCYYALTAAVYCTPVLSYKLALCIQLIVLVPLKKGKQNNFKIYAFQVGLSTPFLKRKSPRNKTLIWSGLTKKSRTNMARPQCDL